MESSKIPLARRIQQVKEKLALIQAQGWERYNRKIAVEVKSFPIPSPMRELESAIGQYRIYRCFMRVVAPERKLYLGISDLAETRFFRKLSIQYLMRHEKLPLLVVNTTTEEIVKWIN